MKKKLGLSLFALLTASFCFSSAFIFNGGKDNLDGVESNPAIHELDESYVSGEKIRLYF